MCIYIIDINMLFLIFETCHKFLGKPQPTMSSTSSIPAILCHRGPICLAETWRRETAQRGGLWLSFKYITSPMITHVP